MQIVDAALRCFTTKGYYSTSVDDIASLASTSRATLYQYFESKDSIFIELMVESGTALGREVRHIQPLGPDSDGYASLCRWLGESCRIYDTYAPMFIEWANVTKSRGSLRQEVAAYADFHIENFANALPRAVYDQAEGRVAALVVLGVFSRYNYLRHVDRPGLTDARLLENLACGLQRYLFPATPDRVLAGGPRTRDAHGLDQASSRGLGPLSTVPSPATIDREDPFDGISDQSATTVRQLLDAAGRVFAANGYHASNIDQIVSEAGLARGTFYRYFSHKKQLITQLSFEASATTCPLFGEFEHFATDKDPARLRDWLRRFLAAQRTYAGVMRSWTEGLPIDPALMVGRAETVEALSNAIEATFGPARSYPLDKRAAGMLFASLLENVPNEGAGARLAPTDEQIVEAQALFTERVIFPG